MQLSDHFSLAEMVKSQTAERKDIPNEPDPDQIYSMSLLCENILEPIRLHYGLPIQPSSGFRSAELCLAIGSSIGSQHAKGEAVDFEVATVDNEELASWIWENLDYDQLILEAYKGGNSGWVHCSYKADGNRKESLSWDRGSGYKLWQPPIPH